MLASIWPGTHQMNASQQHPVDIQKRLDPWRAFLLEQGPLRRGESKVVMAVMASHATLSYLLQLIVSRAALYYQRRIELFQHIPIPLKKH